MEQVRPHYSKAFRCIGGDCEDTCCRGWDVVIDKTAYARLERLPEFESRLGPKLTVIGNRTNPSQYARANLTADYCCPFLSAERLCTIQLEHGEHYLPELCAGYPRVSQRIDGLPETALLLACPEAARLVLLDPGLVPEPPVAEGKSRYQAFLCSAPPAARRSRSPHQYLWEIRSFTVRLLKDREYPLWQRMFLLGMFSKRLKEVTAVGQLELVPAVLAEHAAIITTGSLRAAMDSLPARSALQLNTLLEILDRHLALLDASHGRFRDCVRDFLQGIQWADATGVEAAAIHYQRAHDRHFSPFMQMRPYILENYLLNHVFRTRFPYGFDVAGRPNDPLSDYMTMCIMFACIKALLIGAAGHYGEAFCEAHVVKVVQSFAKAVEQSPRFSVSQYAGLANADGMALLLKN